MIGEAGADVMTKPPDFKIAPEASRKTNFTPLPDFRKPDITEPPKYEEPSMTAPPDMSDMPPELRKMMEEIKTKTVVEDEKIVGVGHEEKPKGFWVQLKEAIKNFFKKWFS